NGPRMSFPQRQGAGASGENAMQRNDESGTSRSRPPCGAADRDEPTRNPSTMPRIGHTWPIGLLCAVALATLPGAAFPAGSEFALQGQVIAGGGVGHARNGCFELSATLGEPTAGS